ncbi:tyrosinase family protein [Pseudoalteromonas luteoviolacea]|uniref:Tyrosinase copper-binding domain-containing protein n=1 Tax=Pseudoalteromonas luteoviolacea NCIMB 1942 TaxID=1365253 RepID=A0A167GGE3_9GAMM|nr:tyrosinase family protein [Pseudoalteromonas luteoviolacea]KZN55264.1 hypothetical protein N482_24330 [Pseudoalteromonas luteoviolacea NCIMB 1942]KZW98925.1 hypothetical protein JL49_20335 [Pseudoalteromonas luteoviolacea]
MRIRKNVNEIKDGTLLWYSKAVEEMKKRDISDPTSWWYQAAIHGIGLQTFKENPLGPDVYKWSEESIWTKATGLPPNTELKKELIELLITENTNQYFWQQCQHGSWFFLPWHRMYLYFFERIVRKTIVDLNGPEDWALPYWNYSDVDNPKLSPEQQDRALHIPPEFGFTNSMAGSSHPNPDFPGLWMEERLSYKLNPKDASSTSSMQSKNFVVNNGVGFGGVKFTFSHSPGTFGLLENVPHNKVHVDIGGAMGDPDTAALDPIFWLHHANIDRLWQSWIARGNSNPKSHAWLNQVFDFHDELGNHVKISTADVLNTENLDYTYTDNFAGIKQTENALKETNSQGINMFDIIGATTKPLTIGSKSVSTSLNFIPQKNSTVILGSVGKEDGQSPTAIHILLENITGTGNIAPVNVFIRLPDNIERHFVGSVGLFGLAQSSSVSARNTGVGINVQLDATEIVHQLRAHPKWKLEDIHIEVEPSRELGAANATIGRISIKAEV